MHNSIKPIYHFSEKFYFIWPAGSEFVSGYFWYKTDYSGYHYVPKALKCFSLQIIEPHTKLRLVKKILWNIFFANVNKSAIF